MDKVQSFAITFRPEGGVTDDQVAALSKWVSKKTLYHFLITEKTGWQRHIHVGLIMEKKTTRSNITVAMTRLFPTLTTQEKSVFLKGIKIMYNADWINKYMAKGDDTVQISKNLPDNNLHQYFPPTPEPLSTQKQKKCSLMYHELEILWYKNHPAEYEVNTRTVRDFLWKLMYHDRIWPMIEDDKKKCQISKNLVRWLNKAESADAFQLPQFECEEN